MFLPVFDKMSGFYFSVFMVAKIVFLLSLIVTCSAVGCNPGGVDRTLDDGATGAAVVSATADKIRLSGIFADDHGFLRRMAAVETNNGQRTRTGGIWSVNHDIFMRVEQMISRDSSLQDMFEMSFCFTWSSDVRCGGNDAMNVPLYSALYVMVYLKGLSLTISMDVRQQANLWISTFNRRGSIERFLTAARTTKDEDLKCKIKGVDMVFVMDESGSIGHSNFQKMKEFAIDITSSFEIAPGRTHVGWINFDEMARVIFKLKDHLDEQSLHNAIDNVGYKGGYTAIGEALRLLNSHGFEGARNTFDIPKVAIVVTDGITNRGIDTNSAAQMLHRDKNVNVFAIGIGSGVNIDELEIVASAGIETDQNHVYHISGFIESELETLQELIRARTCFDAMFLDHDTSIDMLMDRQLSIPRGATVHVAVECPADGLTINACGRKGITVLYISRSSNPNSANYDVIITIPHNRCRNTFVKCDKKRKRQAEETDQNDRIFITMEGVDEENEYDLNATLGDSSTPQVNLQCNSKVDTDRNGVVVNCRSDRNLTSIQCSINNSDPTDCNLPWRVPFTPPLMNYALQIDVIDSLNLTDTAIVRHTVGPLGLDCSIIGSNTTEVVCVASNELDRNQTVCSYRGLTIDNCMLPHPIDVRGWPVGAHNVTVRATDVFGFTAETNIGYLVVADRVGDDMVFSTVLDIRPVEVGVVEDPTVSLCYQVHGEKGKFYNLVSDRCLSINAHVSRPIPEINSHVIDKIGILTVGDNGTCYDIAIMRENCSVLVNLHPVPINSRFEEEGVMIFNDRKIARQPNVIHISVPNCQRSLVDMVYVTCTEYQLCGAAAPTGVLEFKTTRGLSPIEPAHGLVGQFWGRFMIGQTQTPPPQRQRYDKEMTIFHEPLLKQFDGFVSRSWSHHSDTMCFYAGDRQGSPVIQGYYSDYEMEGLFNTSYQYSLFEQDLCPDISHLWNR